MNRVATFTDVFRFGRIFGSTSFNNGREEHEQFSPMVQSLSN